ncbi:MAG: FG-GAP repeat protein [Planctomycetes bacterium]|nr:FG-GAP repeat protein [Planctomycetota bacterium]
MRTSTWLSGRRTAPILVVCLLVWGVAPPPAAAQCESAKLLAFDGAATDFFGFSVSISGDFAVVGAYNEGNTGPLNFDGPGSAYIFRFDGLSWVQEAKLTASDGAANDNFGWSVSISGDVAVIGARDDDANGIFSGSAYVFEKPVGGWVDMTETAKLVASDGAVQDLFGNSVSISGEVIVVGAIGDDDVCPGKPVCNSGSAYVFEKPVGGWVSMTQTAKLLASDGAAGDRFGFSVSISGEVAVVGAPIGDGNVADSGSAYVFEKPVGGWVDMTRTAKLTASDGAVSHQFGISVSISGDVAVIGARFDDDNGSLSGSGYVFVKPPSGWVNMTQTAKLTASDGAADDQFGNSVSISGDVVVVGANQLLSGGPGSAYVFEKPPGGWVTMTETAKLTASDGAANDQFGLSVSISGDVITVGAIGDDDNGEDSGSMYVYLLSGVDCNRNGQPDACDIFLGVSCDSNANLIPDDCELGARGADITGPGGVPDGCVDAFDLGALLAAWCSVAGGNPCGTCGP